MAHRPIDQWVKMEVEMDRKVAVFSDSQLEDFRDHLIHPVTWDHLINVPEKVQYVISNRPMGLSMGHHPVYGWFIIGIGPEPIFWTEKDA